MDRLLTVLVQTSPVPSHPSAALLEALFRSFDRVDGLREATIIILCDGLGGEGEEGETEGEAPANLKHGRAPDELAARYGEHLDLLRERLDRPPFLPPGGGGNPGTAAAAAAAAVRMVRLPHRHGSARAIGAAFDMGLVRTPFVMVAQHDNFFVRDVPLREVLVAMRQHDWIKALHFQATATVNYVEKVRRRYGMDLEGMVRRDWAKGGGGGTYPHRHRQPHPLPPLVPLAFWYGRTHLARTDHYVDFVLDRPLRVGDHLEELLGVRQLREMQELGPELAHPRYGNYVLDQGEEIVLYHLSGRRARAATSTSAAAAAEGRGEGAAATAAPLGPPPLPSPSSSPSSSSATAAPRRDGCASFTTARSARAVVPGLELVPEDAAPPGGGGGSAPPGGRFRQRCFHCGLKGHSYRWCPGADRPPVTEIIDLS